MFTDARKRIRRRASFEGLPLAVLLGVGFGLAAAAIAFFGAQRLIPPRVADWLSGQQLGETLYWRLAGFAAAQLLLHVCFGCVIWLLAIASERALPQLAWKRTRWVLMWGLATVAWLLLLNIDRFPESVTSRVVCCELVPHAFYSTLAAFGTSILLAAVAMLAWLNLARHPGVRRFGSRIVVWGALIAACLATASWMRSEAIANGESALSQPNVIIIGIDSLRADYIGVGGQQPGMTPNVDAFLQDGILIADCVTPVGRTFPAWVSILSGQSPRTNEVRENLFAVKQATLDASVAHAFRRAGYRTVYGTDEVRFSNIDERFGFEEILSPPMGVSDFLLGAANDIPLANLVANSDVGEVLFPETHANRAAAVTYEPGSFVDRVASVLDDGPGGKPLFLAVHLALPHWPYTWAQDDEGGFSRLSDTRYQYGASVIEADRQFGELVHALERAGVLSNAIVVVLSDHGEGLGLARDNLLFSKQAKEVVGVLSVAMWGHGNSVLSPYQNQVVLGVRGFGRSALRRGSGLVLQDVPATLEDVAPTLIGLTGIADGVTRDGSDWSRVLHSADAPLDAASRVRFIESGYVIGFSNRGTIDTDAVAGEGVQKYLIDPKSSRITVKSDALPALLREKERAAIMDRWLLAAVPDQHGQRYILVDRETDAVRELQGAPASDRGDVHTLWVALQARYGSELADAAVAGH
ncbi:sulfatase-like hydrolase/transferase [Povalibacter sp.]|uniref:sulfatase-like hydrolase/transferase n=1 Tax=Povalibacter sp. TaxID=1962978 RepID=UPI002F3F0922